MGDKSGEAGRRSTRLSISISIVLSGKDAEGGEFEEATRTLVINKHGAKVLTTHHLSMGTEVRVENRALGMMAKANVVWLGRQQGTGQASQVGLQLVEAENIWGIEFPPEDWTLGGSTEEAQPAGAAPAPATAAPASAPQTLPVSTAASGPPGAVPEQAAQKITTRVLEEFEHTAETQARTLRERLEKLTQRIGLQMEVDMRTRAVPAQAPEASALEQQVQSLGERLNAALDEIKRLEILIEDLRYNVQPAPAQESAPAPAEPVEEARRRLTALVHSTVEAMNRAAQEGLAEFRRLLQKELQAHAAALPSPSKEGSYSPRR